MINKNKNYIWVYVAVAGLLIFLFLFKILSPFEKATRQLINPVLKTFYSATTKLRMKYEERASKEDLASQIENLIEERNGLIEEKARWQALEEENGVLREQLGFLTKKKYHYVVSNVVSRGDLTDSNRISESIIIDKGSHDGIYNGLGVIGGNGIVIGKVVETKDNIAKVYLTNNSHCKLAATILGDNKTSGVVEGELGLTMKMGFVPQTADIKAGDLIVTSGLEEGIPRGLVIGKVAEIKGESNDPWRLAIVEMLIDPDDLTIVSVILP